MRFSTAVICPIIVGLARAAGPARADTLDRVAPAGAISIGFL